MDQQCLIYFNLSLFQFNLLDPWFLSTDSLTLQERERERERQTEREREKKKKKRRGLNEDTIFFGGKEYFSQ